MKQCIVSFTDSDGIEHRVEVQAESLYEAAVLACKTFGEHDCRPGPMHRINVSITTSVVHTVTMQKVEAWLNGTCRSPKEKVTKERLKAMLTT